ncbi:unnamed protein product [Symbiodinium sp. CCMP2592]|nr:unnamed protein product [Symbiodinium sp. CCMP2592]
MADAAFVGSRLRELAELGHGDGRAELIAKLYQKISFVDCCFLQNKPLGNIELDRKSWEEALDGQRKAPAQVHMDEAESQQSPQSSSPGHAKTEILYIKSLDASRRGVLQLHKVSEPIEGYRILLRAEEVWALTGRSQLFSNFFSKLQDGLSLDTAQAWKATYVLQPRGCRPDVQLGALKLLSVLLETCIPRKLKIQLLPINEDCVLDITNGFLNMDRWRGFLEYSDMMQRWRQSCKAVSKEDQNIERGIRLPLAAWFIFRQPHSEIFKDQVTWGRLQRRLLHTLSQAAEKQTLQIAQPDMPPMQPDYDFHPANKMLGCNPRFWHVSIDKLSERLCWHTSPLNRPPGLFRDGRLLRGDCKPRCQLAVDRFISRGGGFCASNMDASLKDVGLENMTSADFMLRYCRRTELDLKEALKSMKYKSVGLVCDASPKAKMVWLPILVMPETIGIGTLQRLSTLLPSTASSDDKMKVATMISESRTMSVLAEMHKKDLKKQLPKALNAIKQDKLSSRQELKAVVNILSHVGVEMDGFFPTQPLLPRGCNEARQVYRVGSENFSFVHNKESGDCRWDVPMHSASEDARLVLCADQGSPLYSCFQFLAHAGANILLIRDELPFACTVDFVLHKPIARPAKPDDPLMQMFQRDILKENDFEETSDEKLNFQRVMEVLTSEEMFSLFRVARNVLDPFRELCICLNALRDHTLKMNGPFLEKTLTNLAETALNASSLGMLPDIAMRGDQELRVKFRRVGTVLREGFGMFLAAVHELEQYALYLRSAPHKAAGLVSVCSDPATKDRILAELRQEWLLVLELEGTASGAALLKANCFHCTFQCFREMMGAFEKCDWNFSDSSEAAALTGAWFPSFCQSASLESIFGDLSDACKRSGRNDCGSLPNLQCVAVRSLQNRLCLKDGAPGQVEVQSEDWEGNQAYGMKPKVFNPASAPPCFQAMIDPFGQKLSFDSILKPFPATSAWFHTQHSLNYMQGRNPEVAAAGFWTSDCFAAGMLLMYDNNFYVATGKTPGVLHAVLLRELPHEFRGALPEQTTDETRMPCNVQAEEDPLEQGSATKALTLDVGRHRLSNLCLK